MSFTILSATLLLLLAVGIIPRAMRGYRQGFGRTAISLAMTVLCGLIAAPLAVLLSDYPTALLAECLPRWVPVLANYAAKFPAVLVLLPAILDVVLSPVLFVLLFVTLRYAIGEPVAGVLGERFAPKAHDPDDPIYESRNAPWHRRHSRLLGGITGGICGFMVALILLSPVVGLLSVADTALATADRIRVKWSAYGLEEEHVELMHDLTGDPVAKVLEAAGGGMIFDATANTYINGRYTVLRDEVDLCTDLVADAMAVVPVLKDMRKIPPAKREILAGLGDKIDRSEVARLVAADVVNLAAGAWQDGKTFMKVPCPKFNEHLEPLINGILSVCAVSAPDCVGRDISTVADICLIASDNGLMTKKISYAELAASLDTGGVIDQIYNEIMDNPCTAHLSGKMTEVAIRMMATAIDHSGLDSNELKGLMTHLSDAVNRVRGMSISNAERVAHMKEYTTYYAKMYGMNIPGSLAEVASVAVMNKLGGTDGRVSAEQFYGLFEAYMKK